LALRVEEDEVLALAPLVVAGDGQGVAGEPEVAPGSILHPGQLQGGDRLGVLALAEENPAGEELQRLVLCVSLPEALQLRPCPEVVLLVEELLHGLHPGPHVRWRRGPGKPGRQEKGENGGSPHFTSSS